MPIIKNVLMVDDDAAIRRVAEISLSRIGKLNVMLASSGAQALEILETFLPDAILLDVMMPGMDGPGVFKAIRANPAFENIPVIYMTAKAQKHEVQNYFESGISGVIIKPFDPVTLPLEVNSIVEAGLRRSNVA